MKRVKLTLAMAFILAFTASTALATPEEDKALGEQLLQQVWTGMKTTDLKSIGTIMAPGFQAVHQDGASNRDREIALIKRLKLGDYSLSDIRITRNGPVLVATYLVTVAETIAGRRLPKKPAPRLSVFVQTESGWQWMAHANLNPLK